MDTTGSRRSRRKKILIVLALFTTAFAIYCWFFGFATGMVLETRWIFRNSPVVNVVPRPLLDNSKSISLTQTFSVGDYEFETPWVDIDDSKTRTYPGTLILCSHSGQTLIAKKARSGEFVREFLQADGNNSSNLRALYGQDVLASDYALTLYMLQSTPAQIRITSPRKEAVARSMMLVTKAIWLPRAADSGVFSIHTSTFDGFQFGDPNTRPKSMIVDLFSDDAGFEFIFSSKTGPLTLTQPEINRVLQSLHKKAN